MTKRIETIICLILIVSIAAFSQEKRQKVAILDPVLSQTDDGLQLVVREIVSGCFVNYGDNYSIVERSQLDKIMQEAKFSNTGAVDEAQATELGKLAGADKIVLTIISKVGQRSMLSIKMIDVETATVEKQHSKLVASDSMVDVIEPLTLVLLGKQTDQTITGGVKSTDLATTDTYIMLPDSSSPTTNAYSSENCRWLITSSFTTNQNFPLKLADVDFQFLKGQSTVNLYFDYSNATLDDVSVREYLKLKGNESARKGLPFIEELNQYTGEIESRFTSEINDKLKSIKFIPGANAPYTMVAKIKSVDKDGRNVSVDFVFFDSSSHNVVSGVGMKIKGGRIGSFTNLMGDAFEEDAAGKLAGAINKQIKK